MEISMQKGIIIIYNEAPHSAEKGESSSEGSDSSEKGIYLGK